MSVTLRRGWSALSSRDTMSDRDGYYEVDVGSPTAVIAVGDGVRVQMGDGSDATVVVRELRVHADAHSNRFMAGRPPADPCGLDMIATGTATGSHGLSISAALDSDGRRRLSPAHQAVERIQHRTLRARYDLVILSERAIYYLPSLDRPF